MYSLLTIQNLYTSRALTELLKTMKYQSPSPIYEKLKLCPKTNHFKLLCPMHKLGYVSHINGAELRHSHVTTT